MPHSPYERLAHEDPAEAGLNLECSFAEEPYKPWSDYADVDEYLSAHVRVPILIALAKLIGVVIGVSIAAATANALLITLSHEFLINGVEPYSLLSRGIICALPFLGALVLSATIIPLCALTELHIVRGRIRIERTLRLACALPLFSLPFGVGVAIAPHAVPEGFSVRHAFMLCGWGMMPVAILVGMGVLVVVGMKACEYFCADFDC